MERLTVKEPTMKYYYSGYSTTDLINRLAHYEDLEEQGLLLKLPCKVGDELHYICEYMDGELEIMSFELHSIDSILCYKDVIGKGFYLTKEEAEAKLQELQKLRGK